MASTVKNGHGRIRKGDRLRVGGGYSNPLFQTKFGFRARRNDAARNGNEVKVRKSI